MHEVILWSVRLPRVLIAALVGGGLAVVGAALQALFRNPLADAGLLGVGPGAALGAVLAVQPGLGAGSASWRCRSRPASGALAGALAGLRARPRGRPPVARPACC